MTQHIPHEDELQLQYDVESIQQISVVPMILDIVCRITGLGFAAIARVTDKRWITCSSKDDIGFGLKPGDELELATTICNEIRQTHEPVIIDNVDESEIFRDHHTPKMYGLKSYISFPIFKKDGSFFGTLCAIDAKPALLSRPEITGNFKLFADLIAFHLQATEQLQQTKLELSEEKTARLFLLESSNNELEKRNKELESFAYIASHDLQEPLRKIKTFAELLTHGNTTTSEKDKQYLFRIDKSIDRMQLLINDLLSYSRVTFQDQTFDTVDISKLIKEIEDEVKKDILQKNITINVENFCEIKGIKFQLQQVFRNLVDNSVKFAKKDTDLVIDVTGISGKGLLPEGVKLNPDSDYCHITFKDNGIGFENEYNQRIFEIFRRLNGNQEFSGSGIGLSIVKKIIENHHGAITAHSMINEGATFEIYLPVI